MSLLFNCIYGLFISPDVDDPLDSTLALAFYDDSGIYETTIVEHTRKHATGSGREDWRVRLQAQSASYEDNAEAVRGLQAEATAALRVLVDGPSPHPERGLLAGALCLCEMLATPTPAPAAASPFQFLPSSPSVVQAFGSPLVNPFAPSSSSPGGGGAAAAVPPPPPAPAPTPAPSVEASQAEAQSQAQTQTQTEAQAQTQALEAALSALRSARATVLGESDKEEYSSLAPASAAGGGGVRRITLSGSPSASASDHASHETAQRQRVLEFALLEVHTRSLLAALHAAGARLLVEAGAGAPEAAEAESALSSAEAHKLLAKPFVPKKTRDARTAVLLLIDCFWTLDTTKGRLATAVAKLETARAGLGALVGAEVSESFVAKFDSTISYIKARKGPVASSAAK